MATDPYKALSEAFRAQCSALPRAALLDLEKTLQLTFNVPNLRTVQLWTRPGRATRSFVSKQLPLFEREFREQFAKAVVAKARPSGPIKSKTFDGPPEYKAEKMRQYLTDAYTGRALKRITISGADMSIAYEYDAYMDDPYTPIDESEMDDLFEQDED